MEVTLKLTEAQIVILRKLLATRGGITIVELAQSCLDRGIKDRDYRTDRNAEQRQLFKEWKASR